MNPLIKWPGGKTGEISKIEPHIPNYKRYVEPFFGGGASQSQILCKRKIVQ